MTPVNPRRALTLVFVIALAVSLTACSLPGQSANPGVGASVGDAAPEFNLNDLNGQKVSLSELRGKPVLINFWASWCGPCKIEIPVLQAYYEETQGKDLTILAVNAAEPADVVRAFVEENKLTFRVLTDTQAEAARAYRVRGIPASFFIDKDGKIADIHMGPISRKQIDRYLADLAQP